MTVELSTKITKQVEFYFGDANFPRDKFLREKAEENGEGWVPLSTIATFARMRALTEDLEQIKQALTATSSEVYELSEDGQSVRRKQPLPEDSNNLARTLYLKGFPKEATLDELQAFFSQHSAAVQAIRLRRFPAPSNSFKGSVFVEFKSADDAQAFLTSAATTPLSYSEGQPALEVMSKMDYLSQQENERKSSNKRPEPTPFDPKTLVKFTEIKPVSADGETDNSVGSVEIDIKEVKETLSAYPVAFVDHEFEPGCLWVRFKEPIADTFLTIETPLKVAEKYTLGGLVHPSEEEQLKYFAHAQRFIRGPTGKRPAHSRGGRGGAYKKKRTECSSAIADSLIEETTASNGIEEVTAEAIAEVTSADAE